MKQGLRKEDLDNKTLTKTQFIRGEFCWLDSDQQSKKPTKHSSAKNLEMSLTAMCL